MDVKVQVINNVLSSLKDFDQNTLDKIENILYINFEKYEIKEKCTEVVVHDNSNLGLIKKFIATKKLEGKSVKTLKKYQPELEKLHYFLGKSFYKINIYDLRYFLAQYKEHRKISNRTLDNMRKTISSFFSWVSDEGHISYNPTKALKRIKYTKTVKKPFSIVEREKLKNACTNHRDLALVEFLYASGLRVSEAISIDISNIDFISREATVVGKGSKERKFYLSEICIEYLKSYLNSRTDNNPSLFVSTKRPYNRLTKEGMESIVKRIGKKACVENVHPHRFRRTLATDLVRKNVPIQDVAHILGHADLRTTQVYVCLDQESVKYNYNKAIA